MHTATVHTLFDCFLEPSGPGLYSLHTHSLINGSQSEQFHRSCNPSGKLANSLAWKPFLEPGAQTRPEPICQQSNGKWNSWRRKPSSWHRGASRDFGQVTCPTFPPSKVTSNKKEKNLVSRQSMWLCVCTRSVSGKEAKTDACGFPAGLQTLTSLSPKRKHETKCLAPKQTRYMCWGNFSSDSSLVDLRYQKYTNTQRPACWTEIRRLKALTIRVPSRVTSVTRCPVAQAEQKDGHGSAKLWVLNAMSSALLTFAEVTSWCKVKLTIQFKTFLMCQISLNVYQFIFSILLVRYSLCSELYKFKLLSHTLNSITEGSSTGKIF